MSEVHELDKIALNVKSRKLLKKLLKENEKLEEIMVNARNEVEALIGIKNWAEEILNKNPRAEKYYMEGINSGITFKDLSWSDELAGSSGPLSVSFPLRYIHSASNCLKLSVVSVRRDRCDDPGRVESWWRR